MIGSATAGTSGSITSAPTSMTSQSAGRSAWQLRSGGTSTTTRSTSAARSGVRISTSSPGSEQEVKARSVSSGRLAMPPSRRSAAAGSGSAAAAAGGWRRCATGEPGEFPKHINGAAINSWLFNTDTVDKVLDTIQEEGAERLSEILRDPAVQEAIARGVKQAIIDFLRRPVNDVLGDADDPTMMEARETLTGWVVGMARDPATREFLVEKLHEGLEKAGARTWGDVLERVPTEKIADFLVVAARTDIARRSVETGAQRMVNRMLERPIGIPARWFPEDGPERIEAAMGDPIWDWLQTQVPAVVERIDVARRVEEKVLHFPTARMEEIVRKVTDRELRLIVRLGYLLGAIIGLMMVAVDAAMR